MHAIQGVVLRFADLIGLLGTFTGQPTSVAATTAHDYAVTDVLASITLEVPIAGEAKHARAVLLRKVAETQIEEP